MRSLLHFSSVVDGLNRWIAWIASGFVLLACLVSAGNAGLRYALSLGSNAWLELQWYLFAYIVMLGGAFVLKTNEHVRVDLIYGPLSTRAKIWVDLAGLLIFLMPATLYLLYLCVGPAVSAFHSGETSPNAGGLVRWPARMALPIGFALIALQGVSEIVKRIAMLTGHLPAESQYERPLQ